MRDAPSVFWVVNKHNPFLCSASVAVEFDEQSVGKGGAGFTWPSHTDLQELQQRSISLPPHPPRHTWDSGSDEGSMVDKEQDQMEAVVQDPEVAPSLLLRVLMLGSGPQGLVMHLPVMSARSGKWQQV